MSKFYRRAMCLIPSLWFQQNITEIDLKCFLKLKKNEHNCRLCNFSFASVQCRRFSACSCRCLHFSFDYLAFFFHMRNYQQRLLDTYKSVGPTFLQIQQAVVVLQHFLLPSHYNVSAAYHQHKPAISSKINNKMPPFSTDDHHKLLQKQRCWR